MKKSGLFKNIYSSKEKGVEWWLYSGNMIADDILDNTCFYPLPTISYEHWGVGSEEDQNIDIYFKWLFWYFSITRYWGSAYKEY